MDGAGMRLVRLEANFKEFEKYTHERWHDLANNLQPLMALPERLTREVGKVQGIFEGRMGTMSKEIERGMEHAIERAIKPVTEDVTDLRKDVKKLQLDVDELMQERSKWTGARMLGNWAVQTMISVLSAVAAVLAITSI